MKRTTVKLPDDLDRRLRDEAKRRGATISEITREAIEGHLNGGRGRHRLLSTASFRSETGELSTRVDEILAEIYEERDRRRREEGPFSSSTPGR
jgi:predicted transcriptional regulator